MIGKVLKKVLIAFVLGMAYLIFFIPSIIGAIMILLSKEYKKYEPDDDFADDEYDEDYCDTCGRWLGDDIGPFCPDCCPFEYKAGEGVCYLCESQDKCFNEHYPDMML